MIWVILAGSAIGFAVLTVWAATRRDSIEPKRDGRRFDLGRSGLALLAAAFASVAAVTAYSDETIEFPPAIAILGFGVLASFAVALLPYHGSWSSTRRMAAAIIAAVWLGVGLVTWPFAIAATGCACASSPNYVPPAPLGVETRAWITLATVCGPALLALAASWLPERLSRTNLASRLRSPAH